MKLIAHRGNVNGKKNELENDPRHLSSAIEAGFDVELDMWKVGDQLFLGHDHPQFKIDEKYLIEIDQYAWIHAKNIDAALFLLGTKFNWFWHENDKFTLTSKAIIWTYPGVFINSSVTNQPNLNEIVSLLKNGMSFFGICSDFVVDFKKNL